MNVSEAKELLNYPGRFTEKVSGEFTVMDDDGRRLFIFGPEKNFLYTVRLKNPGGLLAQVIRHAVNNSWMGKLDKSEC